MSIQTKKYPGLSLLHIQSDHWLCILSPTLFAQAAKHSYTGLFTNDGTSNICCCPFPIPCCQHLAGLNKSHKLLQSCLTLPLEMKKSCCVLSSGGTPRPQLNTPTLETCVHANWHRCGWSCLHAASKAASSRYSPAFNKNLSQKLTLSHTEGETTSLLHRWKHGTGGPTTRNDGARAYV